MAGGTLLKRDYDLLPPGATVVCAVSGGADSMCLLHYLTTQTDLTVHAAHFDHRLRGEESRRDADFVRDWCRDHDLPFHLGSGDVAAEAAAGKTGVEETARALRYDFLFRLAEELGAQRIATAHNANDNVETVLLHLLRGTGLRGLGGIPPQRGILVRPLLALSREDILAYLEAHRIPHVEDSTNADDSYARNRVRHQLLPLLEEWNPGFVDRMTAAIPRLRADEEALDALARQLFEGHSAEGDDLTLSASLLAQAPRPVALRTARLLLEKASSDPDCAAPHLEALVDLAAGADPSGEIHLPHGLTARRAYDRLVLTYDTAPQPLTPLIPHRGVNPVPGTVWAAVVEEPWEGLVLRARQEGDAITLPGRPRKDLKKLFIDEKVPRWDRDRLPLAADSDGVAALAGFGVNTAHPRSGRVTFIKYTEEENGQ